MINKNNNLYSSRVVHKPWGYEYVIYNDANRLAITFVNIKYGHKTSLHCHPQKKTGFIIIDGKALVQIGIYKKNSKKFDSLSRLVFRPGLFHSIEAISKKGLCALEFETPYKKKDLLRFKDNYGRESKNYEGKKFTKKISNGSFIKFKKPKLGKKNIYIIKNTKILLEVKKNLKSLTKTEDKTSSAILNGSIVDKKGKKVISYGEVIKTETLRILSEKFYIKKPLTILRVSKNNNKKNIL
jgi:mannose-6-phosphate isomerase-like protein (cupin superfamily)